MFTPMLSAICTIVVPVSQSGAIQLLETMYYVMVGKHWIVSQKKMEEQSAFHSSEKGLDHHLVLLYIVSVSSEKQKALHDEDDCEKD